MTHRISRRTPVFCAGLSAGVPVPLTVAVTPATAATTPQATRTSAHPALATGLRKDTTTALANRKGTVAVGLHGRSTDTTRTLRSTQAHASAGVVKATVLATFLRDAKKHNRHLTQRESDPATAVITESDNAAAVPTP